MMASGSFSKATLAISLQFRWQGHAHLVRRDTAILELLYAGGLCGVSGVQARFRSAGAMNARTRSPLTANAFAPGASGPRAASAVS